MMNEQCYYRVSIKGIVIDEQGRILLTREKDNTWDILGGGLDHNEDPIACLRREVFEESGLKVTYISPTPLYFVAAERRGSNSFIANVIYEIKLEHLDFTASDECQELRFFTIKEMQQISLFPTVKKLCDLLSKK